MTFPPDTPPNTQRLFLNSQECLINSQLLKQTVERGSMELLIPEFIYPDVGIHLF